MALAETLYSNSKSPKFVVGLAISDIPNAISPVPVYKKRTNNVPVVLLAITTLGSLLKARPLAGATECSDFPNSSCGSASTSIVLVALVSAVVQKPWPPIGPRVRPSKSSILSKAALALEARLHEAAATAARTRARFPRVIFLTRGHWLYIGGRFEV